MANPDSKVDFGAALENLRKLSGEFGQDMINFIAGAADHAAGLLSSGVTGASRIFDVGLGNWLSKDASPPTTHLASTDTAPAVTAPAVQAPSYNPVTSVSLGQGQGLPAGITLAHDFGSGVFPTVSDGVFITGSLPAVGGRAVGAGAGPVVA